MSRLYLRGKCCTDLYTLRIDPNLWGRTGDNIAVTSESMIGKAAFSSDALELWDDAG